MSLPLSKQRMRKDARNYQLLQMFAVDLERENSTLRSENRALRARVEVLLDALVSKPLFLSDIQSSSQKKLR